MEYLYLQTSMTNNAPNVTSALGNTPTTWAGTVNENLSWIQTWGFGTPSASLGGSQSVAVYARKGSNSNDPTVSFDVLDGSGSVVATSGLVTVSSTSVQPVTASWTAPNGSPSGGYTITVTVTGKGGNPSRAANSVQISHAVWTANTYVAVVQTGRAKVYSAGSWVKVPAKINGVTVPAKAFNGTEWVELK